MARAAVTESLTAWPVIRRAPRLNVTIFEAPLHEDHHAILKLHQVHQVDEEPYQPGRQSGKVERRKCAPRPSRARSPPGRPYRNSGRAGAKLPPSDAGGWRRRHRLRPAWLPARRPAADGRRGRSTSPDRLPRRSAGSRGWSGPAARGCGLPYRSPRPVRAASVRPKLVTVHAACPEDGFGRLPLREPPADCTVTPSGSASTTAHAGAHLDPQPLERSLGAPGKILRVGRRARAIRRPA